MVLLVDTDTLRTLEDVEAFVAGHETAEVTPPGRKAACEQVRRVLSRFAYWRPGRAAKGLLRRCLLLTTGLSESQLTRLAARCLQDGELEGRRGASGASTRQRTSPCWRTPMGCTGRCRGRPRASFSSGPGRCSGTPVTSAWRGSPTGICATCGGTPRTCAGWGARARTRPTPVSIGERRQPRPRGPAWSSGPQPTQAQCACGSACGEPSLPSGCRCPAHRRAP